MNRLALLGGLVLGGLLLGGLALGGLGGLLRILRQPDPAPQSSGAAPVPQSTPHFEIRELPQAKIYLLKIPADLAGEVEVGLSESVASLDSFGDSPGKPAVVAVLNAGFFDPQNQRTTSFVVQSGQITADPRQNMRLMQNPDLTPYLSKILNRSELRRYRCGVTTQWAIANHNEATPSGCTIQASVGAGPQLLPRDTSVAEGFIDPATGRDALGSQQPNARTAIALLPDGSLLWVMVAQTGRGGSGLRLDELANFLRSQGATQALNLDGGSSSSLYFQGKTYYGKRDADDQPIQRPVKSVLILRSGNPSPPQ